MNKGIEVGDIVHSKVNKIYKGTYTVIKTNKTTCHVQLNDNPGIMINGTMGISPIYKNVRYSILKKVK